MRIGLRGIPITSLLFGGLEAILVNSWAVTLDRNAGMVVLVSNLMMIVFLTQWFDAERELSRSRQNPMVEE